MLHAAFLSSVYKLGVDMSVNSGHQHSSFLEKAASYFKENNKNALLSNNVLLVEENQFSFTNLSSQRLVIADGAIELLKWLALIAMTFSHVNYILFPNSLLPALTEIGCLAYPLFGFVLAYNLAREGAFQRRTHNRAMGRMLLFGLIATPFYIVAFPQAVTIQGWLPLNMMFSLLLATGIIFLLEEKGYFCLLLAVAAFVFGGAFVSGYWFSIGYCIAAWYFCKKPSIGSLLLWLACTFGLGVIYPTFWGILAVPIILTAPLMKIKLPRLRLAFYTFYPLHIVVLLGVSFLITHPGGA
jgi:hypothetical protein